MTNDDALFRFRLRVMALAKELGNVRAACRVFGIHHSTYYRWRAQAVRHGSTEMLRPRERRAPRMPNATSHLVEGRVLAYAPGPARQGPTASQPSWPGTSGEPSRSAPMGCGGCCAEHPFGPLSPGGRLRRPA